MKPRLLKMLVCLFITITCFRAAVYSQVKSDSAKHYVEKEIVSWDYHSNIIGEDYTIYVHFPPGYDTSKVKYPVLYMTDGDWNMTVAMNCFNMLRQDYSISIEPLIVGIGYGSRPNKRSRDLDPGNGGPKFADMIEKEVMPFIADKYRVSDNKALYGYSYGGMFTTYVLFEHPGVYNAIFIGAPGNAGRNLIPEAEKYFANHTDLNAKVFLGVGSYEPLTAQNIELFKQYMLDKKCKSLDIATAITPNAGHGAALAQVMQNAMAFAYCKKHRPISVSASELNQYIGDYTVQSDAKSKVKFYVSNGKLYFKENDGLPMEIVPYTKNGFFMYENERADISFHHTEGKTYVLFSFPNETPTRLDKIN